MKHDTLRDRLQKRTKKRKRNSKKGGQQRCNNKNASLRGGVSAVAVEAEDWCSLVQRDEVEMNLLHLVNDGLESGRVVHGEVGEHLAVDLDTSLVKSTHQL